MGRQPNAKTMRGGITVPQIAKKAGENPATHRKVRIKKEQTLDETRTRTGLRGKTVCHILTVLEISPCF